MSLIKRMRKQKAVYWPPTKPGEYGQDQFKTPVEIKCRWEDVAEEFVNAKGETKISLSKVYADRDVLVGGLLRLGTLRAILNPTKPRDIEGVFEIQRSDKLPKLNAKEFLRTAYL